MTIKQAIEIKTTYIEHLPPGVNEDWITADRLSIESLKRLQNYRTRVLVKGCKLLPGETKD
ncbi:unnamed protein product [marine sediment metagenome]|uniref:Uncharacterized protein n=1 Tax=marine sediment metagenome TaxID=412755 RepID=X1STK2_9ZZZZ